MPNPLPLTDEERATYEWQMWTPDFGEAGQERLKGASVMVSRVGGVGSVVAYELAAAGVGKLVLAHGGNPRLDIVAVGENVNDDNADGLVEQADIVVDCAPLFPERYAMNAAAVRQDKPMVECAMYEMEAHITTIIPRKTPCLRCLYPEQSATWTRQFPVFGAVSGTVACMAAVETIKLIAGFGETLAGRMMSLNLREMTTRKFKVRRDPDCTVCAE